MPRVPRYDSQQVATDPLRRPSVPEGAFMPPTPVDTGAVIKVASEIWERESEKIDQIVTLEADNELAEHASELREQALQRRGKDAGLATEETEAEWNRRVGEIEGRLRNDRQKLAFRQRVAQRGGQLRETVERHTANESANYEKITAESGINVRVRDAVLAVQDNADPALITQAVTEARAISTAYATRWLGLKDAALDDYVRGQVSKVHLGALNQMTAKGEDIRARDYLAVVRTEIDESVLPELTQRVEAASSEQEGARAAKGVWESMGPKGPNDAVILGPMEEAIREQYKDNPNLIKVALNDLHNRARTFDSDRKERGNANLAMVWGAVNEGRGLAEIRRMPEYLSLDGGDRLTVSRNVTDRAYTLAGRGREAKAGQYSLYNELSDPSVLFSMTENEIRARQGELGGTFTNKLLEKLRRGPESYSVSIDNDLFKTVMQEAGFNPYAAKGGANRREREEIGRFRVIVETAIDQEQRRRGGELPRADQERLVRGLVDDEIIVPKLTSAGVARGSRKVRLYEATPEERSQSWADYEDIPTEIRETLRVQLTEMLGRAPSRGLVGRIYAAQLLGDTERVRQLLGQRE